MKLMFFNAIVPLILMSVVGATAQQTEPSASPSATVSFEEAQTLASKGRLDKAMELLDQLSMQAPEPAGVERLRGVIYYQREQFANATEAFAKATDQDANDRESMEMQGVSLFRLGRAAERPAQRLADADAAFIADRGDLVRRPHRQLQLLDQHEQRLVCLRDLFRAARRQTIMLDQGVFAFPAALRQIRQ